VSTEVASTRTMTVPQTTPVEFHRCSPNPGEATEIR
jgi:hypothetical protein